MADKSKVRKKQSWTGEKKRERERKDKRERHNDCTAGIQTHDACIARQICLFGALREPEKLSVLKKIGQSLKVNLQLISMSIFRAGIQAIFSPIIRMKVYLADLELHPNRMEGI